MKKYKLLKKFCDEQVEEVGHVFEFDGGYGNYKYSVYSSDGLDDYYVIQPHEIPLLTNAGYLEEVKEVKEVNFEDARWKEGEIEVQDIYWCPLVYGGRVVINNYSFEEDPDDIFRLRTGQAFKTHEAAQAYYESIVGKE